MGNSLHQSPFHPKLAWTPSMNKRSWIITLCVVIALSASTWQSVNAQVEAKVDEANRLTDQVNELQKARRYEEAIPLAEKIVSIIEEVMGPDALEVASGLNKLADLNKAKQDYARAATLLLRSLSIYEKAHGPDHRSVATTLNNLGLVYVAKGEYSKAEPLYQRTLAIFEKIFGPEDFSVAKALKNLGELYRIQVVISSRSRCIYVP
jgi:tetratricopeptide (TPR) repeat protein